MTLAHRLAVLFLAVAEISFADNHAWETGEVLDASKTKESVATGADIQDGGHVDIQSATVTSTYVIVLGRDFAYTVSDSRAQGSYIPHAGMVREAVIQAIGNRGHGCRFIVNDEVKFYQDKGTLHVIDADGKECKTEILRQERVQPPPILPAAQSQVSPQRMRTPVDRPTEAEIQASRPTLKYDAARPVYVPPAVISHTKPTYSKEALDAKLSGTVKLSLVIDADGTAKQIKVISGLGRGLDENAVAVIQQWKFRPATQDGIPVARPAILGVIFQLPENH